MNTCKSQILRVLRNQIGQKGIPIVQQKRLKSVLCEICKEPEPQGGIQPDPDSSTSAFTTCKQDQIKALKSLLRSGVSAAEKNAIRKALCALCAPPSALRP